MSLVVVILLCFIDPFISNVQSFHSVRFSEVYQQDTRRGIVSFENNCVEVQNSEFENGFFYDIVKTVFTSKLDFFQALDVKNPKLKWC
jgi:hypothetical protein